MTRENCALYPQVTQGVKMCSQFVLCKIRSEQKKNTTEKGFGLSTPLCVWFGHCFIILIFSIFVVELCSGSMVVLTGLRVTSTQPQTRLGIINKAVQFSKAPWNHKDKERVWALAQEWLILGELARPTARKCITYGVPFSQLPQREHKKCYP